MDAGEWDERYAASELLWSAEPNRFVAQECADLAPGTALDLAAGEGRNAVWLARHGWRVTAVDFSPVAVTKGRLLTGDLPVTWEVADVTTWRAPTLVDLVVVAYLQVPEEARRAAVRSGFEALRPDGTFLLVAHDSTNLAEGTGGPQDAAVLMTAQDVLGDLHSLPHQVVRAARVERVVAADDGHGGTAAKTAYDCLVRVTRAG